MNNPRTINRFLLALSVTLVVGVVLAFKVHRHLDRTIAQPYRDFSKMMSVRIITAEALSAYYGQHRTFPRALSDLPLQNLRWGDEGSSANDLDNWRYGSDGKSFSMTWTNARGADLFLGGRTGRLFYSEQEMQ